MSIPCINLLYRSFQWQPNLSTPTEVMSGSGACLREDSLCRCLQVRFERQDLRWRVKKWHAVRSIKTRGVDCQGRLSGNVANWCHSSAMHAGCRSSRGGVAGCSSLKGSCRTVSVAVAKMMSWASGGSPQNFWVSNITGITCQRGALELVSAQGSAPNGMDFIVS